MSSGFSWVLSHVLPLCVSSDLWLCPAHCDRYVVGALLGSLSEHSFFLFVCFIEGLAELDSNREQSPLCIKSLCCQQSCSESVLCKHTSQISQELSRTHHEHSGLPSWGRTSLSNCGSHPQRRPLILQAGKPALGHRGTNMGRSPSEHGLLSVCVLQRRSGFGSPPLCWTVILTSSDCGCPHTGAGPVGATWPLLGAALGLLGWRRSGSHSTVRKDELDCSVIWCDSVLLWLAVVRGLVSPERAGKAQPLTGYHTKISLHHMFWGRWSQRCV